MNSNYNINYTSINNDSNELTTDIFKRYKYIPFYHKQRVYFYPRTIVINNRPIYIDNIVLNKDRYEIKINNTLNFRIETSQEYNKILDIINSQCKYLQHYSSYL